MDSQNSINELDALRVAVKAANDTAGPNGLASTLVVFGILPRLYM